MDFVLERTFTAEKIVLDEYGKSYTCGRGKDNEIVCLSALVSRRHCIFFHDTDKLYVTDLKSSNGLYINGAVQKPYEMVKLCDNDIIGLGCPHIDPEEEQFFAYKISFVESFFPAEAVDTSVLSKTVLNCNTPRTKNSTAEGSLGNKRGVSSKNYDVPVPHKIPRYSKDNQCNMSITLLKEIKSMHISHVGENTRINNKNNKAVESDVVDEKVEDDIQIIHASLVEKTKNRNIEHCDLTSVNCSKSNDRLDFNGKALQCSKKSREGDENNEKMMDVSIDKGDNDVNGGDRAYVTEQTSDDFEGADEVLHLERKSNGNFIQADDQMIKLEDELQIIDDDENPYLAAVSGRMSCDMMPIKLKRIKQEPKTRFSEIDVVNMSDEEDGLFPYSQLFDNKLEDNWQIKVEIKSEYTNNDTEKASDLDIDADADNDVIILTDSEDEDNPWLHRLSRSQIVDETSDHDADDVVIKDEIDLGIWEDDDISNILWSDLPCTSKGFNKAGNACKRLLQTVNAPCTYEVPACEETAKQCTKPNHVSDKTECDNNKTNLLLTTKADAIDMNDLSKGSLKGADHTSSRKVDVTQSTELRKQRNASHETSFLASAKRKSILKTSIDVARDVPVCEEASLEPRTSADNKRESGSNSGADLAATKPPDAMDVDVGPSDEQPSLKNTDRTNSRTTDVTQQSTEFNKRRNVSANETSAGVRRKSILKKSIGIYEDTSPVCEGTSLESRASSKIERGSNSDAKSLMAKPDAMDVDVDPANEASLKNADRTDSRKVDATQSSTKLSKRRNVSDEMSFPASAKGKSVLMSSTYEVPVRKETSLEKPRRSAGAKVDVRGSNSVANSLTTKPDAMDVDVDPSNEQPSSESADRTNSRKTDVTQSAKMDEQRGVYDEMSFSGAKRKSILISYAGAHEVPVRRRTSLEPRTSAAGNNKIERASKSGADLATAKLDVVVGPSNEPTLENADRTDSRKTADVTQSAKMDKRRNAFDEISFPTGAGRKSILKESILDTHEGTSVVCEETSLESRASAGDEIERGGSSGANLLTTRADAMDVDVGPSGEPTLENTDHTSSRKLDVKRDAELNERVATSSSNHASLANEKLTSIATKSGKFGKASTRLIQVIEAPHLHPKRGPSGKNRDKTSKLPEEKLKSTTRENQWKELKEKLDDHFYGKERKHRKERPKKATDSLPSGKTEGTSISKEEKKIIMKERKMKLRRIAEEEKRASAENHRITKRHRSAKPRAKVSLKNRGDFLIGEREETLLVEKSMERAKSKSDRSKKQSTYRIDTPKGSVNSHAKTTESIQKENVPKDAMKKIAMSLQPSLRLHNIMINASKKDADGTRDSDAIGTPSAVSAFGKDGGARGSEAIDDIGKKRNRSKERKSGKERSTSDNVSSSAPESRRRSSERASTDKNLSPNGVIPKLVTKLKKRKRVSFSEKVEIREYQIDTNNSLKKLMGKDAPIPTDKLMAKKICTERRLNLEEFLLRIFAWKPVWLEEQRFVQGDPPIVSESELQPMKLRYNSFEQYYEVAMPLLLIEIWQIITKDFEMVEKNVQRATMMCSIVENSITRTPIPSTESFLTTLMLEVLVRREDLNKQTHPKYGDLVSFEYVRNVNGKQTFYKVFAYITDMHQTIITNFTHYNKDLMNYVPNPYAVLTYTMLTRPLEHDIPVNRVQRVRTITYLRATIRLVQALLYLPQSPLLNLILNPRVEDYQLPPSNESHTCSSLVTKDNLNPKQLEAVFRVTEAVLRKEAKLCFIQGPPGTGKSKVVTNLVTQIFYDKGERRSDDKSFRILVCAPSNAAIDEIVIRLLSIRSTLKQRRFNMVRIGRPETMHPSAKDISVTELAKRYLRKLAERYKSTTGIEEEKASLEAQIKALQNEQASSAKLPDMGRKELKRRLNDALMKHQLLAHRKSIDKISPKERAKHQRNAEDTILAGADIITCTLSSCYTKQMESIFGVNKQRLSVCIVDEATQSCEAESLIPLMLGVDTLVLVGDPNQLPATVLSQRAKKLGLDQSIFSRVQIAFATQANNPIIMLDTQYRMAYSVSYWPNRYFYGGKLKNAIEGSTTFPFQPYRVLNHNSSQNNDKFSNTTEAEFVAKMIFAMLKFAKWENASKPITLGVLTPYNNQRTMVLNKINEKISSVSDQIKKNISFEVNTVDGFQGQERDIIIMSCVRSHGIGFLSDRQRLCVALTRAKHSLILCGNFNTFMKDPMWKALLADARSRGILCDVDANATPQVIKGFIVK